MEDRNRILIVDDSVDIVDLLKKRFAAEGYETVVAYDGEEGLAQVAACRPDLIVLDVVMPKLDGFQVLERLRSDEATKYIPVLMLTAKSRLPEKIKGLQRGADDYLGKPFNYKELSTRVQSLLAKEAAQKKQAAEEKTEALDHVVDEVAHEVRNPLTVIGGFARRVHKSLPEGSRNRQYMEIILESVAVLEKMVKELFELKGAAVCYIEPAEINRVILTALQKFEAMLAAGAITVETRLVTPSPLVTVDQENMGRAFGCLIENACEAMTGEKRVLTVSSLEREGCAEIVFSDTGCGIAREKLKNIYDPFFSSKIFGPGLGLTFVLQTVQNHKGRISVECNEGEGTSFTIRLPVRRGVVGK